MTLQPGEKWIIDHRCTVEGLGLSGICWPGTSITALGVPLTFTVRSRPGERARLAEIFDTPPQKPTGTAAIGLSAEIEAWNGDRWGDL